MNIEWSNERLNGCAKGRKRGQEDVELRVWADTRVRGWAHGRVGKWGWVDTV